MTMTPLDVARKSATIRTSYSYLVRTADEITDQDLRQKVLQVLENPAPTFLTQYDEAEKKRIWQMLIDSRAISENITIEELFPFWADSNQAPQPFWSAPGSSYERHHSYPGGLALHTAMNVKVSLGLFQAYQEMYDCNLNRDMIIAGQILHDSQKAWTLQWEKDGSCYKQINIAGTGAHHVLGIAESVYRGFSPKVLLAQTCTHEHPGTRENEQKIRNWLLTACLLAGKDWETEPDVANELAVGNSQVEWFITYQGDHNWVLSLKAAAVTIEAMEQLASEVYHIGTEDSRTFHALRNYVFAQMSILKLYEILGKYGYQEFKNVVQSLVTS
ncbi:MAG TPA: hypothetical protein PKA28_03205 [Methylomusa anaerophila]|nr:hypothetical protein [Methylomusa anaerophila]HML87433.1 hypothetical protein [Methylomusa anaerophila]